jgi:DNA-nicking Smr family endonuclease
MTRKPPDFHLWDEATRSVKPLRHRVAPVPSDLVRTTRSRAASKPVSNVSAPHAHGPSPSRTSAPPLTGLDRRTTQKLTRGQVELDGRLDLHGTGIEVARTSLFRFLQGAQAMGWRTVLVITGKGDSPFSRHTLHGAGHFHAPERAGRLRRLVPEWFHEPEFRGLVAGYQPAHPRHGGGGAFYVRIRRVREGR